MEFTAEEILYLDSVRNMYLLHMRRHQFDTATSLLSCIDRFFNPKGADEGEAFDKSEQANAILVQQFHTLLVGLQGKSSVAVTIDRPAPAQQALDTQQSAETSSEPATNDLPPPPIPSPQEALIAWIDSTPKGRKAAPCESNFDNFERSFVGYIALLKEGKVAEEKRATLIADAREQLKLALENNSEMTHPGMHDYLSGKCAMWTGDVSAAIAHFGKARDTAVVLCHDIAKSIEGYLSLTEITKEDDRFNELSVPSEEETVALSNFLTSLPIKENQQALLQKAAETLASPEGEAIVQKGIKQMTSDAFQKTLTPKK